MIFFRIHSILLFLTVAISLCGQSKLHFQNPVNHEIVLSGSFGELRSTHFHAGLDIKPSSKESADDILCSELGYVSRIKIQRSGYGRALYIDHPNGYTTVYAHLSSFTPEIQTYVESIQRAAQTFEIEIFPEPGQFIYNKGQVIGKLGNSGRSYGPHLHYEIRKTENEHPVNPMLFGVGPKDDIPPVITSIMVYGLSNNKKVIKRLPFNGTKVPSTIKIPAWRAGIGVQGFDLMNGATNNNGIYQITLFVDDTLYYQQTLDEVSFAEMNQIKAHIDYATKINQKKTYALTYVVPGNKLSIIDSIKNDGIIKLYKDKPRYIRLEAMDISGNIKKVETQLLREANITLENKSTFNLAAKHDQVSSLLVHPIEITIPAHSLSNEEELVIESRLENNIQIYVIGDQSIPLINSATLTIKLNPDLKYNLDKLMLVEKDDGKLIDYGCQIHKHSITSQIESFGKYQLYVDTFPPTIKTINFPIPKNGFYTFYISDDVETKGNAENFEYDVYINGNWQACEYKEMVKTLYIPDSLFQLGDKIEIVVKDQKNNKQSWQN